jgi:adenine-specific DNA-methyltransferase
LSAVVHALKARYLLVSFNDEGYLPEAELLELLAQRGPVQVLRLDHPRYVGAKIGIYNPQGVKTGVIGHLRNRELLFLVDCEREGKVQLSALDARATPS